MVSCLLIEPDAQERARVKNLLDSLGMQCTAASIADAALSSDKDVSPDVIIMEASGLPAVKRMLRKSPQARRAPVVIMYGRGQRLDVINETIMTGAAEYLVQPFDLDLLRFKLRQSGVLPRQAA